MFPNSIPSMSTRCHGSDKTCSFLKFSRTIPLHFLRVYDRKTESRTVWPTKSDLELGNVTPSSQIQVPQYTVWYPRRPIYDYTLSVPCSRNINSGSKIDYTVPIDKYRRFGDVCWLHLQDLVTLLTLLDPEDVGCSHGYMNCRKIWVDSKF
jgi:hypothetical protein